jgi:biopolymer transport protein ExbD
VFINGDERADFGIAVGVFDQVRMLGIAKVSVQTTR